MKIGNGADLLAKGKTGIFFKRQVGRSIKQDKACKNNLDDWCIAQGDTTFLQQGPDDTTKKVSIGISAVTPLSIKADANCL